MCASPEIDVRESASDCTLASGGETSHPMSLSKAVSSSRERSVEGRRELGKNRVPDVIICQGYSMYIFLKEEEKHVFYEEYYHSILDATAKMSL
jgi:hypothetical protein